jgi:hypothetical protein
LHCALSSLFGDVVQIALHLAQRSPWLIEFLLFQRCRTRRNGATGSQPNINMATTRL